MVGPFETDTYKIRLDILPIRNSNNLSIFVKNHILLDTVIVTDGWSGYSFLDDQENSVWEHEVHHHRAGDFGYGSHSTSHIEHTWNSLKQEIKLIYGSLHNTNFVYFLREAEFRLNLCKRSNEEKLNIFRQIFAYLGFNCLYNCMICNLKSSKSLARLKSVYLLNNYNFYDDSEILAFDN